MDTCGDQLPIFSSATEIFKEIKRLKNVVFGVRWLDCTASCENNGEYKKIHTDEMFNMLKMAGVVAMKGQAVNILIRSHYAYRSRQNLMDLFKKLSQTNPVTITFRTDAQYHPKNGTWDPLNITEFREAILFFGHENVHLQVTDEVWDELEFDNNLPSSRASTSAAQSLLKVNRNLLFMFAAPIFFSGILVSH